MKSFLTTAKAAQKLLNWASDFRWQIQNQLFASRKTRLEANSERPKKILWPWFWRTGLIPLDSHPILPAGAKIVCMGSCFANEIRHALAHKGFLACPRAMNEEMLGKISDLSREASEWGPYNGIVHYQWYNVLSILQEIQFSLKLRERPSEEWRLATGGIQDPFHRYLYAPSSQNSWSLRNEIWDRLAEDLRAADAFIFTFGLAEIWRNGANSLVYCLEPQLPLAERPKDLEVHFMNFTETTQALKELVETLRTQGNKPVFFTVSPIPLAMTRRKISVVTANTWAKSMLRAAVGEVCDNAQGVYYFPSYEAVMSEPGAFRDDDGRHVKRHKVDEIVDTFIEAYGKKCSNPGLPEPEA